MTTVGRLRPMMAVGTAALLLSLTACGDDDVTDGGATTVNTGPTPSVDSAKFDVSATAKVVGDAVQIEWSLVNNSGAAVLVTNRVPDNEGRISDGPDQTYVLPGSDDGEVELAKRVLPVGSDAVGDSLPWIGVTEVGDGSSINETVRVALPLSAYGPPSPDYDDLQLPSPVDSVVFCVGVLTGREPNWGVKQDGDVTIVNHGAPLEAQTVVCSESIAV